MHRVKRRTQQSEDEDSDVESILSTTSSQNQTKPPNNSSWASPEHDDDDNMIFDRAGDSRQKSGYQDQERTLDKNLKPTKNLKKNRSNQPSSSNLLFKEPQGKFWLHDDRYGGEENNLEEKNTVPDEDKNSVNHSSESKNQGRSRGRGRGREYRRGKSEGIVSSSFIEDKWKHDKFQDDDSDSNIPPSSTTSYSSSKQPQPKKTIIQKKKDKDEKSEPKVLNSNTNVRSVNKHVITISRKTSSANSDSKKETKTTSSSSSQKSKTLDIVLKKKNISQDHLQPNNAEKKPSEQQLAPQNSKNIISKTDDMEVIENSVRKIKIEDKKKTSSLTTKETTIKTSTASPGTSFSTGSKRYSAKKKELESVIQKPTSEVDVKTEDKTMKPLRKTNPNILTAHNGKKSANVVNEKFKKSVTAPAFEPSVMNGVHPTMTPEFPQGAMNMQPMLTSTGQVVFMTESGLMVAADPNYIYGYGTYPMYMQGGEQVGMDMNVTGPSQPYYYAATGPGAVYYPPTTNVVPTGATYAAGIVPTSATVPTTAVPMHTAPNPVLAKETLNHIHTTFVSSSIGSASRGRKVKITTPDGETIDTLEHPKKKKPPTSAS